MDTMCNMKTYAFRLHPGQDLRQEIDKFVKEHDIKAGVIVSCVGSLRKAVLRMAGAETIKTYEGVFEIVSLVGTLEAGNRHLHIAISDKEGNVFGGHLGEGCIIETTAEIVIGELEGVKFTRKSDQSEHTSRTTLHTIATKESRNLASFSV